MNRTASLLLLLALLVGCAVRPPFPTTGQLSQEQLDWYGKRATHWFEQKGWRGDLMDRLLGTGSQRGLLEGRTIDKAQAVEKELSTDHTTVTVHLPLSTGSDRQHFVRVVLNVHTGEVRNWFYVERYTIPSLLKPPTPETLIL